MTWELYDALINGIPKDAVADKIICGSDHCLVRCDESVGFAATLEDTWRPQLQPSKKPGMPLRELAQCIKSWQFSEASLGLAAINAWYNNKDRVRALGQKISNHAYTEDRGSDPFIMMQREVKDKVVTVIGHFPYIDKLLAPVCDMRIIERFHPKENDYHEFAADYLLPESDYVFITSYTVAEKTLPRYLELSKNAVVTLVGPSTPIAPCLKQFGVDNLAGFIIRDTEALETMVLTSSGNTHRTGQKVNLKLNG